MTASDISCGKQTSNARRILILPLDQGEKMEMCLSLNYKHKKYMYVIEMVI